MTTVYLASDHAGFELKAMLVQFLREHNYSVEDFGPTQFVPGDDYPDYIFLLAQAVSSRRGAFGIAIGKSGQGEAMAANRIKGVRAAVFYDGNDEVLKLSREDNDANILSLGAGFLTEARAKDAVLLWLATPFSSDERHARRIKKLDV